MPIRSVRPALDPEQSAKVFNNNRNLLVLAASIRAREIATERRKKDPEDKITYDHSPGGQALVDFANGTCGQEYLDRIR